ncbi:hypothetical protein HGO37_13250 [Rhizobium sp. CG4]|uniref:hypothetical protein n=1 Tax=Rhizobium/Agrobacterium group TaxID=227290 RepID=UPI002033C5C0|nr:MULTISPECIES: hypothetical protein [Rhizobium/Agrobacterium group]MCM2456354.1 hypothetical protein [Rhizobium sp. CG4]MCS4242041.1 hypothetical protein [Rhizobium sp. BIGb0125]MDO5894648.1 hypothetical protein [Agrobacterium sp. Azo12]
MPTRSPASPGAMIIAASTRAAATVVLLAAPVVMTDAAGSSQSGPGIGSRQGRRERYLSNTFNL